MVSSYIKGGYICRSSTLCAVGYSIMSLFGVIRSGADASLLLSTAPFQSTPAHPQPTQRISQPQLTQASPRLRRGKNHRWKSKRCGTRQRRLRCDCGQLAVTLLRVRVGSDPQYIIRLPLCPACLKLEQELHG
jgi:hypothetical protein